MWKQAEKLKKLEKILASEIARHTSSIGSGSVKYVYVSLTQIEDLLGSRIPDQYLWMIAEKQAKVSLTKMLARKFFTIMPHKFVNFVKKARYEDYEVWITTSQALQLVSLMLLTRFVEQYASEDEEEMQIAI